LLNEHIEGVYVRLRQTARLSILDNRPEGKNGSTPAEPMATEIRRKNKGEKQAERCKRPMSNMEYTCSMAAFPKRCSGPNSRPGRMAMP